jgi:hypothetical protein
VNDEGIPVPSDLFPPEGFPLSLLAIEKIFNK